jgi:zinc protease
MSVHKKLKRTFLESSRDLPIVDLYIVSNTGTAHDPVGREGALHLCQRALRRGTTGRTAYEIDALIDRLGAELSTSADATSSMLHATVIRRNLKPFLELMRDIVVAPTLPQREVAQVAREIRAEIIDGRDDDRVLASRYFRRALFHGHPFGRASQGTPSSMERLTYTDARAAWARAYRRNDVIIGASGDISADEFEEFTDEVHGLLSPAQPLVSGVSEPKPVRGRHLVIVDKPGRTQSQIYIGNVCSHPRDRDHMALVVGNTIFGGTFTARLMREIRSKRGWSYGAHSRPAASDTAKCVALQLKLLERFVKDGVNAREVAFAKSYLSRSYAFDCDTPSKRLWHNLDSELLNYPRSFFKNYIERIDAVTVDEVNAAIRKRFSADDLVISLVATASESQKAIEKGIAGLESTTIVPFDTE